MLSDQTSLAEPQVDDLNIKRMGCIDNIIAQTTCREIETSGTKEKRKTEKMNSTYVCYNITNPSLWYENRGNLSRLWGWLRVFEEIKKAWGHKRGKKHQGWI